MPNPQRILALRFSALGDIAMTVPVIKLLLNQHTNIEVTMVSAPFCEPLFSGIERLHFYPIHVKDYSGLAGLYAMAGKIKEDIRYDAVADLHDVLRTKILRKILHAPQTAVICKGRRQKKELTRSRHKKLRPLKTTFERYADVFKELGYPVTLLKDGGIKHIAPAPQLLPVRKDKNTFIGIAPFARHDAKRYPLEKMKTVVTELQKLPGTHIFLFGSKDEAALIQDWLGDNIHLVAGKFSFTDELNIISQMDVMLSMDSANMHLASLYGVPVVSVWGGTHPYLGFYGWAQDIHNALQLDLPCRPSSVYGKKNCPVHGKAGCMQGISPEMIVEKLKEVIVNH